MLPKATREALATKVAQYFSNSDHKLRDAALRLQDDGYPDTDILNILKAAYRAGYDDGYDDGCDQCNDGA